MTDEELIAQSREVAVSLFVARSSSKDRERLAAGLLKELADRMEGRAAAAQDTEENDG